MVVLKKGNGMRLLISALTLTVLIIVSATAGSTEKHDGLMVKDVWSRATLAKNGATYMKIFNHRVKTQMHQFMKFCQSWDQALIVNQRGSRVHVDW